MRELRCAVYARFSSDRQSPTSISDQIRKCRDYAARQPTWLVLDQHIYSDEAISGTSTEREGLQKLLAAAGAPSRPFDCILIDDTSRLTRKLADGSTSMSGLPSLECAWLRFLKAWIPRVRRRNC